MLENWFGRGASELPPPIRLSLLSQGMIISTSLALAAELGIADLLADGPRSSEELAQATSTNPRSLYRLLRLLCSIGVFNEIQTDSFAQTPLSECLRAGVPGSMGASSRLLLIEMVIPAGNDLHPGKFLDFIMLTAQSGQERTEEEYDSLLREADLRLNKVAPTGSPLSVIEAVPRRRN